jgi:membrane dipeptidase
MTTRRHVIQGAIALAIASAAPSVPAAPVPAMPVWDNHAGFAYVGPEDIRMLDAWRAGGAHYLSVNVGYDPVPWSTTVRAIADYTRAIEQRSDLALCATYSQVLEAWKAGRMAVTFDIEGMGSLNGDLSMVELYYRLGVRQMLIAYNLNNDAGGGCHDTDHGLTDFGRAVIHEMNRVGMVVDCAHSGIQSGLEAMRLSSRPCIFSHANARAVHDHERNITDEQIRALAATGGVIGVNGLSTFLGKGPARVETMVTHIDYIARLVGVEHVGIALDCDPTPDPAMAPYWPARQYPAGEPMGFLQPAVLPEIAVQLRRVGYKERDVHAIMGGNFMRIAATVWAH